MHDEFFSSNGLKLTLLDLKEVMGTGFIVKCTPTVFAFTNVALSFN